MDSMDMDAMDMDAMDMHGPAGDPTSHRDPTKAAHTHHPGSPSHSEHCVFGTACTAGPMLQSPLLSHISSTQQLRAVPFDPIVGAVRFVHLPQPRAPPGRLS